MEIPTEPIGSIPRPRALIDAIARYGSGMDPRLEPLYDDAMRDTIAQFEATGSPVITDGEQRKYHNFWTYSVEGSAEHRARRLSQSRSRPVTCGACPGSLADRSATSATRTAISTDALRYANVPLKQAVISPSALSLMYPEETLATYSRDEFIEDLIEEHVKEVRRCFDKGAAKVQIDFTEGRLAMKIDPTGGLLSASST